MSHPTRPLRTVTAVVYNSTNTAVIGYWPDVVTDGTIRFSQGIGTKGRLQLVLPRRLGLADVTSELYTSGSLALDNYLHLYLSDWRTLSGQQADAATLRSGSAETDLSRLMWSGIIRTLNFRPAGIGVTAVQSAAGAAAASPQAHKIGYGCLLDYNLEVSDYRSPGNVDYTGTIEIAHEAYDTGAIQLGDTITVHEDRTLNPDSDTRYNAYSDAARTVYSLEWTARGLSVTFSARAPNLVNDQVAKLTNITRDGTNSILTSLDVVKAAGVQSTADPAGVTGAVTITNAENTGTARSTGVGSVKFADGTDRDNAGFVKVKLGTTAYYVPVFAAN